MADKPERPPDRDPDTVGFEIKDKFFELIGPESFTLGDTVLVEKVTGLDWPSFVGRWPEDDDDIDSEDVVLMTGLVAVAVWHERPYWRRKKVEDYVERVKVADVKLIGGEALEPEEDDDDPPAGAAAEDAASSSLTSPPESSRSAKDASSDETTQSTSGHQDSPTTSQESSPNE